MLSKKDFLIGMTPPDIVNSKDIQLMREAGVNLVRLSLPFPYTDKKMDTLTEDYHNAKKAIQNYASEGIGTMGMIMIPGNNAFDPKTGKVKYVRWYPEWMGPLDGDYYFEVLDKVCEFIAGDCRGDVTYWQIANEQNGTLFMGDLTHEQNERWLQTSVSGVKKGNPEAICGINLAGSDCAESGIIKEGYTTELVRKLYAPGTLFDFLGLDAYFGSWDPGTPDSWTGYIDSAHALSGKPIMIHEWGYSTLQRGNPRPEEDKNRFFNTGVCREKDWDGFCETPYKWYGINHSEGLQFDYIKECARIFANHPAVVGQLFFQWQDQLQCWQCGEPDCPSECAWGILRIDGTPKPGYYALLEANRQYLSRT